MTFDIDIFQVGWCSGTNDECSQLGLDLNTCIAGLLYDWTQNYVTSFYLGGAVTVGGALVLIPTAVHFRVGRTEEAVKPGEAVRGEGSEEGECDLVELPEGSRPATT